MCWTLPSGIRGLSFCAWGTCPVLTDWQLIGWCGLYLALTPLLHAWYYLSLSPSTQDQHLIKGGTRSALRGQCKVLAVLRWYSCIKCLPYLALHVLYRGSLSGGME